LHNFKITGFNKLVWVTGSIVFANNDNLTQIPTFPSLLNVSAEIHPATTISTHHIPAVCSIAAIIIIGNALLRRILGFEALRQVKDGIFISDNPCLTQICGFIHLYRTNRIVINRNEKLSKLIGFCYTDTLNIGLFILDNNTNGEYDLTISAFLTLETAGQVTVIGNSYLKTFKLDALKTVRSSFTVRSNPQLEELSSSVEFVNNLFIENNKSLVVINFPRLHEVNQNFSVSANCALLVLDTFDHLKRIGAGAIIADNTQLAEIKGFNALKYIGSTCIRPPGIGAPANACVNTFVGTCSCLVNHPAHIGDLVCSNSSTSGDFLFFNVAQFDHLDVFSCAFVLDANFFLLLCNPNSTCLFTAVSPPSASIVNYSLIIYGNPRLRAIGGFANLKELEAVLFIVYNSVLHTINAFGQLAFALDIWIRNNPSLKYIIGFNSLISVRNLVVLETVCLCDWNNLCALEFAQNIAIESKTAKAVNFGKGCKASVSGYDLYYSFENKCK